MHQGNSFCHEAVALNMKKGVGFDGKRDGIFKKNVFATYTHIHANGTQNWAKWIVDKARKINFTRTI